MIARLNCLSPRSFARAAVLVELLMSEGRLAEAWEAVHVHRCRDRIRIVRERLGQDAAHAAYLANLLTRHEAKRNFIKLLSEQSGGRLSTS